jgi:tRNA nucleotidyltransferase (CCA-adding enzyme)
VSTPVTLRADAPGNSLLTRQEYLYIHEQTKTLPNFMELNRRLPLRREPKAAAVPQEKPQTTEMTTIIGTHLNADFDALASLLAAQKLYPGAQVVFPGSQEKSLRNFFINSMIYLFNMVEFKSVDPSEVQRLVIVDTRQPERIGNLAAILENEKVEVHIFDHHPGQEGDIEGHRMHCAETGANVTILVEEIIRRDIPVSPDEATVMCLGIYEDTGSFSFASTAVRDFHAAAWLLEKGANLNIIADLISREISPRQVTVLNDMIQAAGRIHINGVEIAFTSVSTDTYVPDFAFLVHKMVKMENLDAIFALARMGGKVYVVARSRIPEVDAGSIVAGLGGGGHAYAAAATIRDRTLIQVEHQLLKILQSKVRARRLAGSLMSSPPIFAGPDIRLKTAGDILTRYNINALLIMEGGAAEGAIRGYISRQIIEKALFHGLGDAPVSDYMNTDIESVAPDADLPEIQKTIIENKQRILPVVKAGRVVGVLTRTDLLNILIHRDNRKNSAAGKLIQEAPHGRTRNIGRFMRERLSGELIEMLASIGRTAARIGCGAFVVGGFVRDLFLYRPNEDIDIVIEGDGIAFARQYARKAGARLHTHEKFGTAVIIFEGGFKIDVASARLEYYQFPAALPTVEMSSIKLDLYRRDFTINTLAIHLNPDRFGTLIDFFGAQKDLKSRVIRVLHNLSFVEDPTRVFRAIRFEQRFAFTIGKLTANLIDNAARHDFTKKLSGVRVFTELRLILEEENPALALKRLAEYNLLETIHPQIRADAGLLETFKAIKKVLAWYDLLFLEESYIKWFVYFLALLRGIDRKTTKTICRRFELKPAHREAFCDTRFEAERRLGWLEHRLPCENSRIYRKLAGLKTEFILYMMAATRSEAVRKATSAYISRLRYIVPQTRGRDLQRLGYPPGPLYGRILDALLDARLNGRVHSAAGEIAFIEKRFGTERVPSPATTTTEAMKRNP